MAVQKGILTPWELQSSGQTFHVADGIDRPCFRDRFGYWQCEHDHDLEADTELQDVYQWSPGWTAQLAPDQA